MHKALPVLLVQTDKMELPVLKVHKALPVLLVQTDKME